MREIAFIYAGQGSQQVGMGADFYEKFDIYKNVLNAVNIDFDVKDLSFNGPFEMLSQTAYTQPCMVAFAVGVTDLLTQNGINPEMTAGLSLGEYSALYASGVLSASDVVPLVRFRGQAMENAVSGTESAMSAVLGLDRDKLLAVCHDASDAGVVEIANYNCPGQLVISGEKEAVEKAGKLALECGAKRVLPLSVSGPFHTSLMKPAGDALAAELKKINFNEMKIPVVFNCTGGELSDGEAVSDMLVKQVQSSVYFEDSIRYMLDHGVDTFIEIGPGKVLAGFVKKIDKSIPVYSIYDVASFEAVIDAIKA